MEAIAGRLEAIASRLEAIASRLETIAIRLGVAMTFKNAIGRIQNFGVDLSTQEDGSCWEHWEHPNKHSGCRTNLPSLFLSIPGLLHALTTCQVANSFPDGFLSLLGF